MKGEGTHSGEKHMMDTSLKKDSGGNVASDTAGTTTHVAREPEKWTRLAVTRTRDGSRVALL